MKHLQESTDTVKSTKKLTASIIIAAIVCAALVAVRIFVPIPKIEGVIPNIIALAILIAALAVVGFKTADIKKLAEQKTSNKTLIVIGIKTLGILIYFAFVLLIPEAISSGFKIEIEWLNAAIRAATAGILLIPAYLAVRKIKRLFNE